MLTTERRIKTSKHLTNFANTGKRDDLYEFIAEYRRVMSLIINLIWANGYKWIDEKTGEEFEFNISKNLLKPPRFIDYNLFKFNTFLSGRALSSLVTQASGILGAATEKQRKRLKMLETKKKEGENRNKCKLLIKKIKTNIPQKPNCSKVNPEFSSKCAEFTEVNGKFDAFLALKSIRNDKRTGYQIRIPVKFHKQSRKLQAKSKGMLNSFLINEKYVNIRWDLIIIDKKTEGKTVGADQGMKDIITFSDGQLTPKTDKHGHSLESILEKLSRKKKGSAAFHAAQDHRTNYINWSINQLNLQEVSEVRLEKIWNIGYKTAKSRKMSHWTNTTIRDKMEDFCSENGVRLEEQSSTYRSQRCSCCGVVRKANRKGKVYFCKHCGNEIDADFNAAKNHEINLPEIPYELRKSKLNRGNGFFWKEDGFFDYETDRSLESLYPQIFKSNNW